MNQYYHPSSNPIWVNDDWIVSNTTLVPGVTPLDDFVAEGFYEVKVVEPSPDFSPGLYDQVWTNSIEPPYLIQTVSEYTPKSLDRAQQWMLSLYPDQKDSILAATSVDELQQLLNTLPQPQLQLQ